MRRSCNVVGPGTHPTHFRVLRSTSRNYNSIGLVVAGLLVALAILSACCGTPFPYEGASADTISGKVVDRNGPVAGAVVRAQTTDIATISDVKGQFHLKGLTPGVAVSVSAWAKGYYITASDKIMPPSRDVQLTCTPHPTTDNRSYQWMPSLVSNDKERKACAECHSSVGSDLAFSLPADEWRQDAHAQSAVNPRFLSMYNGTDLDGHQSPPTSYGTSRDYGRFPLPPDPSKPYYGPGHKLDFPQVAGNCAACHAPAAAINAPYAVDPNGVTGVGAEGSACDFCHKVLNVRLNAATGLPNENMPGVLSLEFRRPSEGHQFFAGPLDDVAPGDDTYAPVQRTSQYCAPCHHGVFWDTVVYNSFGEWLESPYSDPDTGKTCQECHMPRLGVTHFVLPEKGGRARAPSTIFSHRMPGAADEELLRNTVTMTVAAEEDGGRVNVCVEITNDQAGHHVPTDSPLRHLILLVTATDEESQALALIEGSMVPQFGGIGDSETGAYAGIAGKAFAKILEEQWTGVSPTGAYWNPTRVVSDNRIAVLQTDQSAYVFRRNSGGPVTIRVQLLFRRAFYDLQRQKGWNMPDIVMEDTTLVLAEQRSEEGS